jgi:hypothetical protein
MAKDERGPRVPDVKVLQLGEQTVVEIDADPTTVLDPMWRQRWAAAGRAAEAPWCSASPAHCSVRVAADRAAPLIALADEVRD